MMGPIIQSQSAYRTLGAVVEEGATLFRVWAPDAQQLELVVCGRPGSSSLSPGDLDRVLDVRPMMRDASGCWSVSAHDAGAGTLYKFRLDGRESHTFPDPASRYQPFGVHGPSAVVDPGAYRWTDRSWQRPALDRLVFYELHVGTFTREGTFRGVTERLPYLAELGVTAIELMPLADFAGERNWGYDGVALYAPARCYGAPDDLRDLVDAAHAHGLAVFLDVVYNHFGPDGAYATAFSPYYLSDAHESPWGRGVNLDGPHSADVRRFFIENALHWVSEYHIDGLRLDATHALVDDTRRHFLAELTSTVRAVGDPDVLFIAEDHRNLNTLLVPADAGGYGIDAVWADDFHHQLRVRTAGDREGYYMDYSGSVEDIAETMTHGWFFTGQLSPHWGRPRGTSPRDLAPKQFVVCIQNHDQVGNRADGARLNHQVDAGTYRALSTLLLLAPHTPLLFMGQEWAADSPFLFFTDFDAELGRKVTEGRRQEFSAFRAFADPDARRRIPDPQDAETFRRSQLEWDELRQPAHAVTHALYTRLLWLRAERDVFQERWRGSYAVRALDAHTVALDYYTGRLVVVARLTGAGDVRCELPRPATVVLTTEDPPVTGARIPIQGEHAAGVLRLHFDRPGAVVLAAV
jgi:maltooligosyltrehalose trehalohydrolase